MFNYDVNSLNINNLVSRGWSGAIRGLLSCLTGVDERELSEIGCSTAVEIIKDRGQHKLLDMIDVLCKEKQ